MPERGHHVLRIGESDERLVGEDPGGGAKAVAAGESVPGGDRAMLHANGD
jgi:hypothetical protein